jgi:two-component system, OmpR family, response regulator
MPDSQPQINKRSNTTEPNTNLQSGRQPRILLMDESFLLSLNLATSLEMAGFEVSPVQNAKTVPEKIENINLVIINEDFPKSTETCLWLREKSAIPIILLVSHPDGETWNRAVDMGVDACLDRRLNRPELIARIKTILRRYHTLESINVAAPTKVTKE